MFSRCEVFGIRRNVVVKIAAVGIPFFPYEYSMWIYYGEFTKVMVHGPPVVHIKVLFGLPPSSTTK
jgi:hypothetical protein